MRVLDNELKNKTINYDKLLEYGFIKQDNQYVFKVKICNEQFEMIVVACHNEMTSKLIDTSNEEEYVLVDVKESIGEFVGKVREEYEGILNDILKNCTSPNVFKSEQSKNVIKYVKAKYGTELEFLWDKFAGNAVLRNKESDKWYGILIVLSKRKLGINSDEVIDVIDLRYQKELIKDFVDNDKIFPGYHMNKNSWITIKLDGSVENGTLFELIDNSYNLSNSKIRK